MRSVFILPSTSIGTNHPYLTQIGIVFCACSMNATVAAAAAAAAAAALRARLAAAGKLTPAPSNTLLINPPAMMAPQAAPTVTSFNMEVGMLLSFSHSILL